MIKKAVFQDNLIISQLALLLWPDHTLEDLMEEISTFDNENSVFFIAYAENEPIGFAQCQLRHDYVEGTESSPVGYLEGIFVKKEFRNKGYGQRLLNACENWAKTKGCKEFASDCELDNHISQKFHSCMGFGEANRIICFTKKL